MNAMKLFLLALFMSISVSVVSTLHAFETSAEFAILQDFDTGTVLFEKDSQTQMIPSSMTKMMTGYIVFEKLKKGEMTLEDQLPVSEKAWRIQGSKMFVPIGETVSLHDLLLGIIVQSGNDACIVVAEAISGSEEAFAERMTETARALGMKNTTFKNASGWPDEGHVTTAQDLAILAKAIIENFPEYYEIYNIPEFTYHNIRQFNRNPILGKVEGADGLKTGHTEAAKYGLTASAKRGDRRLILVVNGLNSEKERGEESARMMEWGFREFDNYKILNAGTTIGAAEVWLGDKAQIPLTISEDIIKTLPRGQIQEMKFKISYEGPVPAPIQKNQEIATLLIEGEDMPALKIPLIAAESVQELGWFGKKWRMFKEGGWERYLGGADAPQEPGTRN